jgi:HK97 family phage prohead protease
MQPMHAPLTAGESLIVEFEMKAISSERREIEGYAATWDLDQVGDVITRGAFAKSIAQKGPGGFGVYVNHDVTSLPVGALLDIHEDDKGLWTKARIFDTSTGNDLLATTKELMALGRRMSMSIGFRVPTGGSSTGMVGGKRVRRLSEIDLVEVSYTMKPANQAAQVLGTKNGAGALYEDQLVAFFEDESRRQEVELREFFAPGSTLRMIDEALADQNRREDLAADVALLAIDEALSR